MNKFARLAMPALGLLFVVRSSTFGGPSGWFWQWPMPQGNSLRSVAVVDENTLVAVGDVGTIVRSIDRGESWTVVITGLDLSLEGVAFADTQTGIAVGDSETILRSTDGGQSWSSVSSGKPVHLFSVCLSGQTGIAVGSAGTILRSTDSGASWVPATSGRSVDLYGVHCLDESTATAVGDRGTILRTADGGKTWVAQWSGTGNWLFAVAFSNPDNGWVLGPDFVLHTSDGGTTWTTQVSLPLRYNFLRAVSAQGDRVTVVGGGTRYDFWSVILQSGDGGAHWAYQILPYDYYCRQDRTLYGVAVLHAETIVAVGAGGDIERSSDGGATWTSGLTCLEDRIGSVSFVDENRGWVVGRTAILHTEDGGSTWVRQSSEGGAAVFLLDAEHGWVVGENGTTLRTTDGGANWTRYPAGTHDLSALSFIDVDNGWAVGGSTIVHTTDGGVTWTPQDSGTVASLGGISFSNANRGIAVGQYSTILQTSDGGESWISTLGGSPCTECDPSHSSEHCCHLMAVSFSDADTAVAVGFKSGFTPADYSGLILRTTDAGSSWTRAEVDPSTPIGNFDAVSFADANNGLVVGVATLRTTDGGQNWRRQQSGRGGLTSVSYVNPNTATAVSIRSILRTVTGGD